MIKLHTNLASLPSKWTPRKRPSRRRTSSTTSAAGHYDNTIFHRVIPGFMVQGGGFAPGMKQKPCKAPIKNEADNGLKNDAYTLAMARTNEPHSATAQFFINVADNAFSTTVRRMPRVGVTASSARSSKAPRWSTRSRASHRLLRFHIATCRSRTS
jgi:cyclophilin family peptidyl-prolyl cis-trans isomerase